MAIYVYAPVTTETSKALVSALGATRLVRFDGLQFLYKNKPQMFTSFDRIVCWGGHVPQLAGVPGLNYHTLYSTPLMINTHLSAPHARGTLMENVVLFSLTPFNNDALYDTQLDQFRRLGKGLKGVIIPSKEFYGYGTALGAFSTQYKLHIFNGKVIRAFVRHDLRNDSGYKPGDRWYKYNGLTVDAVPKVIASVGVNAIDGMALNFGVVSVALGPGYYAVRKILTAPDLPLDDVDLYAKCIHEWAHGMPSLDVSKPNSPITVPEIL